ncbi:MAG: hypothetical protein IJ087_22370 [Eggerthellaceae bacterium]|nr:hypothetical protein [Eggerthellaceae bacterium]
MELDCGIPRARLVAWLDDELALDRTEDAWRFSCEAGPCTIALAPLAPRRLGTLEFERTSIVLSGDRDAIESFLHLFTLRFASAGG